MSEIVRGHRGVYVCDKITMKVIREYESVPDAAKHENISYSTMKHALNRRSVNRWGRVVYRYAVDYDLKEVFDGKIGRPIAMLDTSTKELTVFYTAEDAAKKINVSSDYVRYSARNGKKIIDRYICKYAR